MAFEKKFNRRKNTDEKKVDDTMLSATPDYYSEGLERFDSGCYIEAMEYFQAAITKYPDRENSYLKLAETYVELGRIKEASSTLYKLLVIDPNNEKALKKLSNIQQTFFPTAKRFFSEHSDVLEFTIDKVSFKMITVKGGTFTMGATPEQDDADDEEETPAHSVTISDYYIGETQVTQALWKAVMGNNPSFIKGDNLPVDQVTWEDCQVFIKQLNNKIGKNFRLPTEAEWEYAARGGQKSKGFKYSGSNNIDNVAWYDENSGDKTHAVKQKNANELGLYDMSGNVWECCQDWYGEYDSSAQTNPSGPSSGSYHVTRGGGCSTVALYCRVTYRDCCITSFITKYNLHTGFRLALEK